MTELSWAKLRSDIYIRDRGICWICHNFVSLQEYDLVHLIDRCNGGHDDYDNLAVMHKSCNLAKPKHFTLEEAVKWRLTAFIHISKLPPLNTKIPIQYKSCKPKTDYSKTKRDALIASNYESLVTKIKPNTICWVQGKTTYKDGSKAPMWKVLPPPYSQNDLFTLRCTPPGAIEYQGGVVETLQIIGGGELPHPVDIHLGFVTYHIFIESNKLRISIRANLSSNTGARSKTIGNGFGQIPIQDWLKAKSEGYDINTFRTNYKPDGVSTF